MWYRRMGDEEVIGTAHHCAVIEWLFEDKWVEMNGANIPIITNNEAYGMTVKAAKIHFSSPTNKYEFFESKETPPIFEKFQLLGDVFNGTNPETIRAT